MVYHCDCCLGSDAVVVHYKAHIVHNIVVVAFVSVTLVCAQYSTIDPDQSFPKT